MFTLNSSLNDITFVTLRFNCLVNDDVEISWPLIYRLRKDIVAVASNLIDKERRPLPSFLSENPCQSNSSPYPFTFDFGQNFFGRRSAGDEVSFDLRFFGRGSAEIEQMIDILRSVILMKWSPVLPIELQSVAVIGLDGAESSLLEKGSLDEQPLVFQELSWWYEGTPRGNNSAVLEFVSPTRLQSGTKAPFFEPEWKHIVPYIVKRVVAVLSLCNVTITPKEEETAFESLVTLETIRSSFKWIDVVQRHQQPYGGFVGEIELQGYCLDDVHSWLARGSLFHIGKGASFGAGSYLLSCD